MPTKSKTAKPTTTRARRKGAGAAVAQVAADQAPSPEAAPAVTPPAPEWVEDSRGNRCSVTYFVSLDAAQAALDSLKNCERCFNCSGCSGCSGCLGCSDCSGCSGCSDCSGCSGCSYCSYCSYCSDCSGCSYCSDCSGCSYCSDCSRVAWLDDKIGLKGNPGSETPSLGRPSIPTIPNIHAAVLAAVSNPSALDMGRWHSCQTKHCRAGWVVHLAGNAGYALERFHNTALAAQLIYRESNPKLPVSPVRFFEPNDVALADIKAMAKREAALAQGGAAP